MNAPSPAATVTRDFTVAVFVVCRGQVLLHRHPKLNKWLPPGGHIEPNELPDEAAVREIAEEAGFAIRLVGNRGLPRDYPGQPVQLVVPVGVQLETIGASHQHIDLVYFAVPDDTPANRVPPPGPGFHWLELTELTRFPVPDEVRDWCHRAVRELAG